MNDTQKIDFQPVAFSANRDNTGKKDKHPSKYCRLAGSLQNIGHCEQRRSPLHRIDSRKEAPKATTNVERSEDWLNKKDQPRNNK